MDATNITVQQPCLRSVCFDFDHARKFGVGNAFVGYVSKSETFSTGPIKNSTCLYTPGDHRLTVPVPVAVFESLVAVLFVALLVAAIIAVMSAVKRRGHRV